VYEIHLQSKVMQFEQRSIQHILARFHFSDSVLQHILARFHFSDSVLPISQLFSHEWKSLYYTWLHLIAAPYPAVLSIPLPPPSWFSILTQTETVAYDHHGTGRTASSSSNGSTSTDQSKP
jgi:hypothetical protein